MTRLASLALFAWLTSACGGATPAPTPPAPRPTAPPTAATHWLEDTPDIAFGEAQRTGKRVLADLWAPWCHTCLSMQAEVLRLDKVPELATVVLLSVDTERASNEAFLSRYPVGVWPTFYLLDGKTGEVRGRWLGAATPAELGAWLRESDGAGSQPDQLVREADALVASRDLAAAEERYRAALAVAPSSWPRRGAAAVSLLSAFSKQRKDAACLELALQVLPSLKASVGAVDFAATALGCADRAGTSDDVPKLRALAEQSLSRDCSAAAPGAAADDQADACGNLRRVREALGDKAGALRAAEQALSIIEAASAGAPPDQQAIYDWERTSSLLFLGRAERAEALLLEREKQLPQSYNPPHYLARLYRDEKRWADGLAAIERALAKAYGPRRVGFLGVKADLLRGAGKLEDARKVLEQQLSEYRALPGGQRQPEAEAAVQKKLDTWKEP